MAEGRYNHTATLLGNGQVLVAGGTQSHVNGLGIDSVELFQPETGSWILAASLNHVRQSHTATRLNDGRVLVAGGQDDTIFLDSVEIFDPTSGSWEIAPPLNESRYNHTATLLTDGRVMVVGGFNDSGSHASVEVFDPVSNAWSQAAPLNTPRNGHSANPLNDGRVLVSGGYNLGWLATAELYNPASNSWTPTSPIYCHGVYHSLTTLSDGRILAAGGACGSGFPGITDKVEIFSPVDNSWQAVAPLSTRRYAHTATLLPNGLVLVAGGANGSTRLNSAELFDPATGNWTLTASMSDERLLHTATISEQGDVLVVGGLDNSLAALQSAERFLQRLEIVADKDSTLRKGNPNLNEGANPVLRVRSSGPNRALVAFNLAGIPTEGLTRATLVLTIDETRPPSKWGPDGRLVDIHRLAQAWAEGNGKQLDLPPAESDRGSGPGATWACAVDTEIGNKKPDCEAEWQGAGLASAPKTAPGMLITNGLSGQVSWDVTQDVLDGAPFGWLIRKEQEGASGNIRFYALDGAAITLAPRLILEY
jgi:N-acetylneuraminic acid mutarotase